MRRKTLQELTLKSNFLFAAAMLDEDNCKDFLEMILEREIDHVEVSYEKSVMYHPEYRGIRLDVFAKDKDKTRYIVEMQIVSQALEKRIRYYHGQMDMDMLLSGAAYPYLPDSYVIFICDFDPVGAGRYRYTVCKGYEELPGVRYEDGSHTIMLSTKGHNEDEVPLQLVRFLQFVRSDLRASERDFEDPYVAKLQKSIRKIKASREMGEQYMLFEEMMQRERKEGRTEGRLESKAEDILDLLEEHGSVPDSLREAIMQIEDPDYLRKLLLLAARAASAEEFAADMKLVK